MEIYIANYNSLDLEKNYMSFYKYLNNEEQEKVNRYAKVEDKARCVLGILLTKGFAWKNLNSCTIEKGNHGKPYIKNAKSYFYNITHSKDMVAIAISNEEVGIDIEYVRPINTSLFEKILSKEEIELINSSENKLEEFYKIWTIKESFVKKVGTGVALLRHNSFDVDYQKSKINYNGEISNFKTYRIDNYRLSVCSDSVVEDAEVSVLDENKLEELISFIK